MGRPQVRAGLVVAVRVASQVLRVAAAVVCCQVFVCPRPEAGGARVVHGRNDDELHAEMQGLGREVAAPRLQFETARRAPGVLVRAVRLVCATAFCCFVISFFYESGRLIVTVLGLVAVSYTHLTLPTTPYV